MGAVVSDGIVFNTDGGLSAPGGFLDRLTNTVDQVAQNQAQMRGYAPALAATGIPVPAAPTSILASIAGMAGLAPQQSPATAGTSPPGLFARLTSMGAGAPAAQPAAGASPQGGGDYFSQVRAIESGGRNVDNSQGSGATGPYQFMPATWAGLAAKYPNLGLTPDGIHDPQQQEVAMRAFTTDNMGILGRALGRAPTPGELYLAHQQGPQGAVGLLTNPNARASDIVGQQAVVQNGGAPDMTAGQFAGMWGSKFGGGGAPSAQQSPTSAMAYAGPQGGAAASPALGAIEAAAPQPPGTQQPVVGASGWPSMPQATADQADPNGSGQSPQAPPTMDQVRAMMANPATRAQGMKALQAMQQNLPPVGPAPSLPQGLPSPMAPQPVSFGTPGGASPPANAPPAPASASALPGMPPGLTPAAIGAMIAEPATRAQGLALWQSALSPPAPTFGKPGEVAFVRGRPAYQIPAAPMNVPQGDAVYDPSTRSPAFQNAPKLELKETGRDAYGQPTYGSFNPQSGAVAPIAGGAGAPGADASGGSAAMGQAFLSTLPPQIASQVQAIAEGRMALPTGQSANNPMAQRLRGMVLQYKPDFDVTDTAARAETRKDFASGNTAGVITAGNTALQHLGHLSDAGEMLTASQIPLVNKAGQAIGTAAGANIAGKQYDGALNDFAGELTKFYRGTGGTEADINAAKAALAPNQSPAQRRASIAQQMALVQSKVNALQARWKNGMGPNTPDYPLLQPEAQDAIARIAARGPSGTGGAPGAQAAGPLPVAAPAGASATGAMPTLSDPSQVRGLPSGTRFKTPDGRIGVAP